MQQDFTIEITDQAAGEIESIARYISDVLHAPGAAYELIDDIDDTINSLSVFPERYPLVEADPWHSEGVRRIAVKNYLIYYWPDKEKCIIEIISVIYSKRDQLELLKNVHPSRR